MNYYITDIVWDTDDEDIDLPTEVTIPQGEIEDEEEIADWLSDNYGWLVESFRYIMED